MKRKLLIAAALLLSWSVVSAQGVMEASKFSQTDLRGTARSMSMGGAFGALGGDISAIAINPAGIGVYKSSEIVTTLDFQNAENKSISSIQEMKENKFKVAFNNFAFVGTFPLYNDVAPLINFGFSYNKVKNFNKKYSMNGVADGWSLADYMTDRANGFGYKSGDLGLAGLGDDVYAEWRNKDWLSLLGYNSYLMSGDANGNLKSNTAGLGVNNGLFVEEKGSVNKYDFNMGTTFEDMLSVGLTISVTDIDYKMYSMNYEDFYNKNNKHVGGYDLINELKTEGTGWELGLGVIFKPIQELRIGVAYHSPTWYQITDHYYADLHHDLTELAKGNPNMDGYSQGVVESMNREWSRTEYEYRTPDKWTFSMAGVLGKNAIISLDYELVDYSKSNYKDRDGRETQEYKALNKNIKDYYRLTSTLRVGGEYRFTPQFSGRVGYSWQQSPYSDEYKKAIDPSIGGTILDTPGAIPHYVVGKDTHYVTWGLGYRFTRNFYTDLAFVYRTQEGDLYTHAKSEKTKLKENSFQGALTLGFRF